MIRIILDNNKSRILGDAQVIYDLINETKIRVQNYFFARRPGWDGYIRYISEQTGLFSTGMLPQILALLKEQGVAYEIEDRRTAFKDMNQVNSLGKLELRDYQQAAVSAILDHRVAGVRFQRGILWEATNAGKNLIAAAVFKSFSAKRKGLFLIDEKEIFEQAIEELKELIPGEVGYMSSHMGTELKRLNVCMIQTLGRRLIKEPKLRGWLADQDIIFCDEADKSASSTAGKRILAHCTNATVRVALTGTAGMHKDKTKNQEIINYFGPIIHKTSNKDLVDGGHSTPPLIKIYMGNEAYRFDGDFKHEHEYGIVKNQTRHDKIWRVFRKNEENIPALIMFKFHEHGEALLKSCPKDIKKKYRIKMVHHETANRSDIIKKFKAGKIDILICSMIIRRGKNIKLTKMMINAAGGDSVANVLQLLGRLLRKSETKKRVIYIDFYDWGAYLQRHSKHRLFQLRKEKFPLKELYINKLKRIQATWKRGRHERN